MAEAGPVKSDDAFKEFMSEVKKIEKRDAVLTGAQQIDRLLRPGSKYGNLNPFEVLLIDPETPPDKIRKAYRKISFLVHPDKNLDDRERAQKAFEAVSRAYKLLEDEEQLHYCKEIVEEAKVMVEMKLKEKRKIAKKQGKQIEEDKDPDLVEQMIRNTMTKLFADYELKRQKMEEVEAHDRKREREEIEEVREKAKKEKEWKEEWDGCRGDRVTSWRSFKNKGPKKTKTGMGLLKPPKLRQEKR